MLNFQICNFGGEGKGEIRPWDITFICSQLSMENCFIPVCGPWTAHD